VSWLSSAWTALHDGLLFSLQYNPLWAALGAALAAALVGFPKAKRDRRQWAALVLLAAWLVGDGLRILARARDYFDSSASYSAYGMPVWQGWVTLGAWALGSLALGYAAPAIVGAMVGKRVTHGTGWLAAAAIASALTLAVSAGVGALG
jgi:hypothetical protein